MFSRRAHAEEIICEISAGYRGSGYECCSVWSRNTAWRRTSSGILSAASLHPANGAAACADPGLFRTGPDSSPEPARHVACRELQPRYWDRDPHLLCADSLDLRRDIALARHPAWEGSGVR